MALCYRMAFFMWRRQAGKSYFIAALALWRMLCEAGHSCFVVSASVDTGREVIEKEAAIWYEMLERLAQAQEEYKCELGGNVVDRATKHVLSADDLADLIEKQRVQIKLYHSRSAYSRTKIIAPNPRTARGWTGDILADEFAFWEDFAAIFDAVEPIIQANPTYRFWGFTTPPRDDTHYSYEMLNPGQRLFEPNPRGNWYPTENGYPVQRLDAYDAALAGVPMYHPLTAKPCSYDEYRQHTLDKTAADRNYLLRFKSGGIAAISKAHMDRAQAQHMGRCYAADLSHEPLNIANIIPQLRTAGAEHWFSDIAADAPTAMGLDLASTTKRTSNPSALTITQELHGMWVEVLTLRFKTDQYSTLRELLRYIIHMLPYGIVKQLSVDASNETLAASKLAEDLPIPVVGFKGGQNVTLKGQPAQAKYAMGITYTSAYEDGRIAIAPDQWVAKDRRAVIRNGDKFEAAVDDEGNHADSFDSGKLALWGLVDASAPEFSPTPCTPRANALHWDYDAYDAIIAPNNSQLLARPF